MKKIIAIRTIFLFVIAGSSVLFLFANCTSARGIDEPLQVASPESQGIDSLYVARLLETIKKRDLPVHSVTIVKNGYLVYDHSIYPYDGKFPHDLASITKSIVSLCIGAAIYNGFIATVDDAAVKYLPEYDANFNTLWKRAITIRHLLTMTSGLSENISKEGKLSEQLLFDMQASDDWGRFVTSLPCDYEPGTHFSYNSAHINLLAIIIRNASGMPVDKFLERFILNPLGITEFSWEKNSKGEVHGWGDLRLYPRDLAKIGYLCLCDGVWKGKKLLPEGWVYESFEQQVRLPHREVLGQDYGFAWWPMYGLCRGIVNAQGRGGQRLTVWKSRNLIVVMTGGGYDYEVLARDLIPLGFGICPLIPSPKQVLRLRNAEAALDSSSVSDAPEFEQQTAVALLRRIGNEPISAVQNPFGISSVTFASTDSETFTITITFNSFGINDRPITIPCLISGKALFFSGRLGHTACSFLRKPEPSLWQIAWNEISLINSYIFEIRDTENDIAIGISEKTITVTNVIPIALRQF